MESDAIFEPLRFRNLTVKNRLFRSSISGRWDNEDGSGTQARINWEEKFARGGVGAIVSSFVPVHRHGRMLSHYAMIDSDGHIPFWRRLGERVHAHDCKFILQLSHTGRQRGGAAAGKPPRPAGSPPRGTGSFPVPFPEAASRDEIPNLVDCFAQGARRAREAGLDGVELHASHGDLALGSGDRREDGRGGSPRERYGFLREVIRAIRREVGDDFHLQVKMNASDPAAAPGSGAEEQLRICQWLEADGVDALHISAGRSTFPLVPPGAPPPDELNGWYGGMQSSGLRGFFPNYTLLHYRLLRPVVERLWHRTKKRPAEAARMALCREIRQRVKIPVIDTGGFQDGALIRQGLREGCFDGVSMARPLIANPDLPRLLAAGRDVPERPCSFCNRCLVNAITNPLGCYDQRRFASRDAMIDEVMSIYREPSPPPVN